MKTYGGVDVAPHFLDPSPPPPQVTHWIGGWVRPSADLDRSERSWSRRDSNSGISVVQPVASRYTDCATAVLWYWRPRWKVSSILDCWILSCYSVQRGSWWRGEAWWGRGRAVWASWRTPPPHTVGGSSSSPAGQRSGTEHGLRGEYRPSPTHLEHALGCTSYLCVLKPGWCIVGVWRKELMLEL
jgi:hypothetical protein